jgi:protein involved in polysaccharide export with SLBB domain
MRLLRKYLSRFLWSFSPLAVTVLLAGCDTNPPSKPAVTQQSASAILRVDPLQVGDRLLVELSGIPDPPEGRQQEIDADGNINLIHIGKVKAAGKSPSQLEKEIEEKYVPDWYPHITVTVAPLSRFFYVGGQVAGGGGGGGRIPWTSGMTILRGIQAAGDFTPFANRRKVQITRAIDKSIEYENCVDALKHPEKDLPVYPGDDIYVGRRGF